MEPFERSEIVAFASVSRQGYFGDDAAPMHSNSSGDPRIVLGADYGQASAGSLSSLDLTSEMIAQQLQGCAARYAGKTVIVTGGARGIGEGCIRVFFEAGSNVVCCDRDEVTGMALVQELNQRGTTNKAFFVGPDVSAVDQLRRAVDATVAKFGRLDCVVNNAGWHPPHRRGCSCQCGTSTPSPM
jgi:hypothetical protein